MTSSLLLILMQEWLFERFAALHQQESHVLEVGCPMMSHILNHGFADETQRLHAFEIHLDKSEARATQLLEIQTQHAKVIKTQTQAQEVLGVNAKIVHAMLEKVTSQVASLDSIIEETATRFKSLQYLDGVFGVNISFWTVFSLILSLMAAKSPRVAGIMSAFAGEQTKYR